MLIKVFLLVLIIFSLINCSKKYEIFYKKGLKYQTKKDIKSLKKAVQNYDKAITTAVFAFNQKQEALTVLGIKLSELKMYLEAIKYLKKALTIYPGNNKALYYLGLTYGNYANTFSKYSKKNESYLEAEKYLLRGLASGGEKIKYYKVLALLYGIKMNNIKKGIKYINMSLNIYKNDISALFIKANLLYRNKQKQAARQVYLYILTITKKGSSDWKNAKRNVEKIY